MLIDFPLTRPLVALDLETDGYGEPEQSHIVEIGFHVEYPDQRPPLRWNKLINPERLIQPEATEVHGIKNEDIVTALPFHVYAAKLAKGLSDCDFAGYYITFDLRVMAAEMARAGISWTYEGARLFDALRLWQLGSPRTLSEAVRQHLHREPTSAHRALGDAEDALEVGLAMLKTYQLPTDLQQLHDRCFPRRPDWVDGRGRLVKRHGEIVLNFGAHRDKPLSRVPRDYLEWMLTGNFAPDVKRPIREFLNDQSLLKP